MVPEEGVARISLGGFAIGLCGAAPGFRAPESRALPPARRRPKPVRPLCEHQIRKPAFAGLVVFGAGGGGRTRTALLPRDFESH